VALLCVAACDAVPPHAVLLSAERLSVVLRVAAERLFVALPVGVLLAARARAFGPLLSSPARKTQCWCPSVLVRQLFHKAQTEPQLLKGRR
jgi:hypothetical protein